MFRGKCEVGNEGAMRVREVWEVCLRRDCVRKEKERKGSLEKGVSAEFRGGVKRKGRIRNVSKRKSEGE